MSVKEIYVPSENPKNTRFHEVEVLTGQKFIRAYSPFIGDNGNWFIYDDQKKIYVDTGVYSRGADGLPGTDGVDGVTPHIGENKNWWVGETDTGITAEGKDGTTPHIGENNHWWIGDVDTEVDARGEKGNDGDTPHIGENGHWYIGDTDMGVTAKGADGYTPQKGVDYFDGADGEPGQSGKSAYQYAQDSGYTGTEAEFSAKLAIEYLTQESDPTVPDWAKHPEKPTYTASEVGADAAGTAESKVSAHNTATDAHNDIRLLVQGLTKRLDALADSDDETLDQMSEVVAYIKSNKSLIDAITTGKVSVSDIVDNLTTNVSNKPLSASQGVKLKTLIDAIVIPTKLSELENDSGYAKTTDIPDKLPNPQKLTFAGAVTAEYDGSGAVTVTIPEGSGGSGGTARIEKLSTDTTVELEPNKLYIFPEMSELTITMAEPSDTGIANEYHFVFQSGTTATALSIPATVELPSSFSVDANKIYELSVMENCLTYQSWDVSASA